MSKLFMRTVRRGSQEIAAERIAADLNDIAGCLFILMEAAKNDGFDDLARALALLREVLRDRVALLDELLHQEEQPAPAA